LQRAQRLIFSIAAAVADSHAGSNAASRISARGTLHQARRARRVARAAIYGITAMLRGSFAKTYAAQLQRLRKVDRVAADLNVVLMLFVIGLGVLDLTCLFGQQVVSRLPELATYAHAAPPADDASLLR
jgi:hypothetical protein